MTSVFKCDCLISAVQEEMSSLKKRYAFGQGLDLDLLGFEFDDKTLIPGVAVASRRAKALAGNPGPNFLVSFKSACDIKGLNNTYFVS
jgi:hypothetical protein